MLLCLILKTFNCIKVFYLSDNPFVESTPVVFRSEDPTILEDLLVELPFVTTQWNPLILPKELDTSSPASSSERT